jgi:hypothetical protein
MDKEDKIIALFDEAITAKKEENRAKTRKKFSNRDWYDRDIKTRRHIINESPPYTWVDILCQRCDHEQHAVGTKHVSTIHSIPRAVYIASCDKCGATCQRHITDKNRDPWWHKSKKLRKELKSFEV